MTIGTVRVGTQVETTVNQPSIDLPYPTTAVGDLLIVAVSARSANLITVPAGFTSVFRASLTGSTVPPSLMLAYKSATGSETGNLTVTTPFVKCIGQVLSVPGIDLTNPLNVAVSTVDQSSASSSITLPSITTGSDGCLLIITVANNSTTQTATPPSGFTETADLSIGTQPFELAYMIQSSAGATGTETVTWSSGAPKGLGVLAAFNPRVNAPLASSTAVAVTANDPTVTVSSRVNASAELATVTATAFDAIASQNRPNAENAAVTAAAFDVSATVNSQFVTFDLAADTQVVPGVTVRIRAVWDGVTYDVWRGNVDSWGIDYWGPHASTANVSLTDVTKRIALSRRAAGGLAVGAGEDTGARIDRILDSAGWNHVDRIIATGDSTVQATDLSGNAWDEALTAAQSEGGEVFADQGGRIVFRNRRASLSEAELTVPQAIFGDHLVSTFNLVTNPSFATGLSGWNAGGTVLPTLQWTADDHYPGAVNDGNAMRVLWGDGGVNPSAGTTITGLTVGTEYTASMYVNVPTGSPDVFVGIVNVAAGTATSVKGSWVRISCTFTATLTAHAMRVRPSTTPTSVDRMLVDAAQFEVGSSATPYDDGNLPAELPFYDVEMSYDDDELFNLVGATIEGGIRQEASDDDSLARYGFRAYEATGLLLETDDDAANYAGYVRHLSRNPELRISSLVVHPRRDPENLWPAVLGLKYGQLIRINLSPPGGGARISRDCYIRGIAHTITPQGEWETRFTTQSASKSQFWTIGDPVLGLIGSSYLSF